jgi:hypothetical protein
MRNVKESSVSGFHKKYVFQAKKAYSRSFTFLLSVIEVSFEHEVIYEKYENTHYCAELFGKI